MNSKKRRHSEETKKHLSDIRSGEANPFYGRKHSEETRRKMSEARRGSNNAFYGKNHKFESLEKIRISKAGQNSGSKNPMFGKKRTEEEKKKISDSRVRLGSAVKEKNPNWRGGIAKGRASEMQTTKYRNWRNAVLKRDNYTCQFCGTDVGNIQADHIKQWAFYPELRYDVDNGRTLCFDCHKTTFKEACQLGQKIYKQKKLADDARILECVNEYKIHHPKYVKMKKWVGVDLDSCLAKYTGWKGPDHIGKPVPRMLERVKKMREDGIDVRIFTARASDANRLPEIVKNIEAWCLRYIGEKLPITCTKDFGMVMLFDDRCMRVEANTGNVLGPDDFEYQEIKEQS